MKSQLIHLDLLSDCDRAAMYKLLTTHFEGVTGEVFQTDLRRKNWVLLLKEDGTLKGFSTFLLRQTTFAGESFSVIYSGDTIVDPSAWSSATLPRAWIAAINHLHQASQQRLYWLLICSGFRTYRFLPTFWKTFYPRYELPTPPAADSLMHHLAAEYYGADYQPRTGLVRFAQPQTLRESLIEIPEGRLTNLHVQFFKQKNPDYAQGDELVCLTEICPENLTRAGQRMSLTPF
jgi:hypothetical protein